MLPGSPLLQISDGQGDPLKSTPPNLSKYKYLYNFWHLEQFGAGFDGILYLENLGGGTLAGHPVTTEWMQQTV